MLQIFQGNGVHLNYSRHGPFWTSADYDSSALRFVGTHLWSKQRGRWELLINTIQMYSTLTLNTCGRKGTRQYKDVCMLDSLRAHGFKVAYNRDGPFGLSPTEIHSYYRSRFLLGMKTLRL